MSGTPPDVIRVLLFDKDGLTRLAWLRNARNCQWVEANSKAGWVTFEVPLDDDTTAQILMNRIVRLVWFHKGVPVGVFAARISSEAVQLAVDGRAWLRFEQQPGLLSLLGDAVVYPQGGFQGDAPTTRNFGFMSPDGPWRVDSQWATPRGQAWDYTGADSIRNKRPPDFAKVDKDAQWISLISPNRSQPALSFNYFRATFHVGAATDVEILHTADNYLLLYVDGQLVSTLGPPDIWQWRQGHTVTVHLDAGSHLIAARVQNSRTFTDTGRNAVALLATVRPLDPDGTVDATVLLDTNTSDWTVHHTNPEPGWHRAQVLLALFHEAQDRGCAGPNRLGQAFTSTHGSGGQAWVDRGQYTFDVGQIQLDAVATQLAEHEMDVWVKPHAMKLAAARRRGRDRSGRITLTLGKDNGNLKSHETSTVRARFTVILGQAADGQMIQMVDRDAIDAGAGRVEVGMSLGNTDTAGSASFVATHQLAENSSGLTTVGADPSVLTGAVAYKDYAVGDSITVPARRGVGTMKVRVLGIAVDGTQDVVAARPLFVGDTTA